MKPGSPLLFLDTNVVMAAVLSQSGGSRAIFELARENLLRFVITEAVALEAFRKIQQKYGQPELLILQNLLADFQSAIKPTPTLTDLEKFNHLIVDQDDRHILAGAVNQGVDYLITLDKKHFFTQKLERANLGFSISTPGGFLEKFREQFDPNGQ